MESKHNEDQRRSPWARQGVERETEQKGHSRKGLAGSKEDGM